MTIRRTFDPASASVTDELFGALQDVDRSLPMSAPPLSGLLDPDALDHLFPAMPPEVGAARVTFSYAGVSIVVSGEGFVRVEAPLDVVPGTTTGAAFDSAGLGATSGGQPI